MGFKSVVKSSFVRGWNFKAWLGYDTIVHNGKTIKNLFVSAVSPGEKTEAAAPKKEKFEECIKRLNISEAALQKKIKASGQAALLYLLFALPVMGYTIYVLYAGFYLSGFVCLMLSFLCLSRAFREHFNRFQMRRRKLGCTFAEWADDTFGLKTVSRKKQ